MFEKMIGKAAELTKDKSGAIIRLSTHADIMSTGFHEAISSAVGHGQTGRPARSADGISCGGHPGLTAMPGLVAWTAPDF